MLHNASITCSSFADLDGEVVEFLKLYLNPNIPNGTDEVDAQQFIVHRNSSNASNSVEMVGIN